MVTTFMATPLLEVVYPPWLRGQPAGATSMTGPPEAMEIRGDRDLDIDRAVGETPPGPDMSDAGSHRDAILDQFTRQAVPFSTAPGIKDEEALRLVVEAAGAGPDDSSLDVACGPGLLVCAFARASATRPAST